MFSPPQGRPVRSFLPDSRNTAKTTAQELTVSLPFRKKRSIFPSLKCFLTRNRNSPDCMSSQHISALTCFCVTSTEHENKSSVRVLLCVWLRDKGHNIYMILTASHEHNEERGHLRLDKQRLSVGLHHTHTGVQKAVDL